MATISVNIRLRPIRLAFLVDPEDTDGLREVIHINTLLWGGAFNVILPTYSELPEHWASHPVLRGTAEEAISGYLDFFDPDCVVQVGTCVGKERDVGARKTITVSDILGAEAERGLPAYGIGIFEILHAFIEKELKFVRRHPTKVMLPVFEESHRTFLAAVFGEVPQAFEKNLREGFASLLEAEQPQLSLEAYASMLADRANLYLQRLSCRFLGEVTRRGRHRDLLFFMDAGEPLDLMDFWNLRAVGWNVIPVPRQAAGEPATQELAKTFVDETYWPYPHDPKVVNRPSILRSRCAAEDEAKAFLESLGIARGKVIFDAWYPRIWEKTPKYVVSDLPVMLDAKTVQREVSGSGGYLKLENVSPSFAYEHWTGMAPRFANVLSIRSDAPGHDFAEVIPEGGAEIARAFGTNVAEWRSSKYGLVHLEKHVDFPIYMSFPSSEAVFKHWLAGSGWTAELSPAGRAAKQMLKQLGGMRGRNPLAVEGVVAMLCEYGEGSFVDSGTLMGKVHELANRSGRRWSGEMLLDRLVKASALRQGIAFRCGVCGWTSWYSVAEVDYEVQCPRCLERIELPSRADELAWAYRTTGPFALPGKAQGAYCVLLALRFFTCVLEGASTSLLSFEMAKDEEQLEADIGLFFSRPRFGETEVRTLFVECKTAVAPEGGDAEASSQHFTDKDVDRALRLSEAFPRSILVFATLKKKLGDEERPRLLGLVEKLRTRATEDAPLCNVLVLTGTELYCDLLQPPPYVWEGLGGEHERFAGNMRIWNDLDELCNATQQLYLGATSWHEFVRKKYEAKYAGKRPAQE